MFFKSKNDLFQSQDFLKGDDSDTLDERQLEKFFKLSFSEMDEKVPGFLKIKI